MIIHIYSIFVQMYMYASEMTGHQCDLHEEVMSNLELNGTHDKMSLAPQHGELPLTGQVRVDTGARVGACACWGQGRGIHMWNT